MLDYIFPLIFKKCTTASPMNTNMEMNPKAFKDKNENLSNKQNSEKDPREEDRW